MTDTAIRDMMRFLRPVVNGATDAGFFYCPYIPLVTDIGNTIGTTWRRHLYRIDDDETTGRFSVYRDSQDVTNDENPDPESDLGGA